MENLIGDMRLEADEGDEASGGAPVQVMSPSPAPLAVPALPDRWLLILQHITEGAIAHLELQELLREVLTRVREAMGLDNAAILLVSEDGEHLVVYAARGPEEEVTGKALVRMGRGVAGTIAARRKPMIIEDLQSFEVENPLLRATARSLVGAPIIAGDRVLGVIHVDSALQRHFTTTDLQLLQIIADRVALAIEHAQLYEAERVARRQAEASAQQLQALQVIGDVALEHARLDDLLSSVLARIQDILAVDNVAILLPTHDGTELTLYSVHGPEEAVLGLARIPFGEGVAGTIAATRRPLIVQNLATVPVSNPFLREHFCSLLGVPLLAEGRLVGVLHADSVLERQFTDAERQLLEALGERIAIAIARAQEYEGAQRERDMAERQVAVLQETTERMDEFLSIASHELRTPLTNLTMNVQLLESWLNGERGRQDGESDAEYMARAIAKVGPLVRRSHQSVDRLHRLVDDLLATSRIREGHLDLRLQSIDLATVVREIVDEHQQTQPTRTLRLTMGAPGPLPVEADPDRIGQVLNNLLVNAAKYSDLNVPITVVVSVKDGMVRVSVQDKGVGIPQSELEHVWERFYRVPGIQHQTGSQVGLGLGLYICRDIVVRHGGQVGVESTVGVGSTFWFSLRLASPEPSKDE